MPEIQAAKENPAKKNLLEFCFSAKCTVLSPAYQRIEQQLPLLVSKTALGSGFLLFFQQASHVANTPSFFSPFPLSYPTENVAN